MTVLTQYITRNVNRWLRSIPNLWKQEDIQIITDGYDWVVSEISKSLSSEIARKGLARVSANPFFHFSRNKLLHFNSVPVPRRYKTNRVLATWYHVNQDDPRLTQMQEVASRIDRLHPTAQKTKQTLIQHGFPEDKIRVVPMGIDLNLFSSSSPETIKRTRESLGIPTEAFVIGSFQKDGDGWGEGMNPKLIKGPDVFCDVIERLAKDLPVHVLLSGPSRGYVKARLTKANVPFTHRFLNAYQEVNTLYQALDVYLISSRTEGVPLALLESWATGTPLVSTRVGMVADVAKDDKTALLADIEDRDKLTFAIRRLFENPTLRQNLITQGLEEVKPYGWEVLIDRYWSELYKPLL